MIFYMLMLLLVALLPNVIVAVKPHSLIYADDKVVSILCFFSSLIHPKIFWWFFIVDYSSVEIEFLLLWVWGFYYAHANKKQIT